MKLETFFEKFEMFADAPNAVAKMRELILESAIRGKLVPRNVTDEPASELLKRIASVQAGQVRKQAVLPPVGDDSYLQIPSGWVWTRLGNTGRIFNGDSVSESGKAELAKVEDGLPFIATKDVGYGRAALVYDNGLKVPLCDPRFKVARANAVLICAEGGSAGRKIGVTNCDVCFGNKLYANEVWEWIHHRYVFYVYQAPTFFKEFAARMTGIIGGIARSEFLSIPFPLPPLAEQKRIVAKVDELMALCDRLEAQQQEREEKHKALSRASLARFADAPTPANLQFIFHPSFTIAPADLRKSILTLAVQGKLVPQDPEDEPAEDLLHLFRKEQASCWPKEYEEPQGFSAIHLPRLPSGWHWYRAEQICGYITKGTTPEKTKMHSEAGEVPFLKVYNLTFNGGLDFSINPTFVSRATHKSELARSAVTPNDVLMNIVGPPLGKVSVVTDLYPEWNINQAIAIFHPLSGVIGRYLCLCLLQVLELSALVGAKTRGTAGQDNISLGQCRGLPIPLPPLAEQRRIVAKVDELMKLVDTLEMQLAASRATAANLLAALVAELTGTPNTGKASIPASTNTGTGTGRRGRPPKSS
jgi:type I restriction enzyme S subunit